MIKMAKIKNHKTKINEEWVKTVKTSKHKSQNKEVIESGVIQNIYEPFIYYNYEVLNPEGQTFYINLRTVVMYSDKTDIYDCTRSIHEEIRHRLDIELVNCCFFTRVRTIEPELEKTQSKPKQIV